MKVSYSFSSTAGPYSDLNRGDRCTEDINIVCNHTDLHSSGSFSYAWSTSSGNTDISWDTMTG